MPRAFLKFRFRGCFKTFWFTGALTGARCQPLHCDLPMPSSKWCWTEFHHWDRNEEPNFIGCYLKIFEIVCTELLNCDCLGVWGFCTCCASLEEYQFGNVTSATFRLWHAWVSHALTYTIHIVHGTHCCALLPKCWEDPETKIKQWPWIFPNHSVNGGCWILKLQSTLVAWISKHTLKRTKRELESQT